MVAVEVRSAAVRDPSAGAPGVGARGPPGAGATARGRARSHRTALIGSLRRVGAWRKSWPSSTLRIGPMGLAGARDRGRRVAPDGARDGQTARVGAGA